MPKSQRLPLERIFSEYRDGDEHGWGTEFRLLWKIHRDELIALLEDVSINGIKEPVLLGTDGRVWDGHHRLAVACALRLDSVPVDYAG